MRAYTYFKFTLWMMSFWLVGYLMLALMAVTNPGRINFDFLLAAFLGVGLAISAVSVGLFFYLLVSLMVRR